MKCEEKAPALREIPIGGTSGLLARRLLVFLADCLADLPRPDPPYNIAAKDRSTIQKGQIISTMQAWGAWDSFHPFDYDLLIMSVISECYRVLKPDGALYMFTAREQNGYFVRKAILRGFTYRNQLAIVKKNPLPSLSKSNWRSAFEACMYLTKGTPKTFNFVSQSECKNVFHVANAHRLTSHPTEKPLELMKLIVQVSANAGDLVVDPFMGSGTTAVACWELMRKRVRVIQKGNDKTFSQGLEELARRRSAMRTPNEPSLAFSVENSIALTLDQIDSVRRVHENLRRNLLRIECYIGTEIMQREPRIPVYEDRRIHERDMLRWRLLQIEQENRRLALMEEEKLRGLHNKLMRLMQTSPYENG